MPPQLLAIRGRNALCLKTGKKIKVENNDEFFLVPASSFLTQRASGPSRVISRSEGLSTDDGLGEITKLAVD